MWRNYVTVGLRALAKNKTYAFINIFGLAIGLAACLMILLYVRYETSYDQTLPNAENTYQLQAWYTSRETGETMNLQMTSFSSGAALKRDFPQVDKGVYALGASPVVMKGSEALTIDQAFLVNDRFFDVLQYPLVEGNPMTALAKPGDAVISETEKKRLFGDGPALGKTMTIVTGGRQLDYRIGGVMKDIPKNSHTKFSLVARFDPVSYFADQPDFLDSFDWQSGWYYFTLKPGTDPKSIQAQMPAWEKRNIRDQVFDGRRTNSGDDQDWNLVNIRDVHLGEAQSGATRPGNDARSITTFAIVAALILAMACVNFTNLATARASQRAREVALRKVLGASRKQLILQFLGESIMVAALSMCVALALVELALPGLSAFLDADLELHYFGANGLILPIIGLVLLVGAAGGIYPSFYLSRFQPAQVLKANKSAAEASGTGRLRNVLVVGQFAVSIGLIICTAVVYAQTVYAQTADPGYNRDGLIQVESIGRRQLTERADSIVEAMKRVPGVVAVGRSAIGIATRNNMNTGVQVPGREEPATIGNYAVDAGFFDAMGVKVIAGRQFDENRPADDSQTPFPEDEAAERALIARGSNIVINELAAKRLGFTPREAVGKQVNLTTREEYGGRLPATIIGVVQDSRFRSIRQPLDPIMFRLAKADTGAMIVRYDTSDPRAVMQALENTWRQLATDVPFDGKFSEDIVRELYEAESARAQIFAAFAVLAVIVACLGLFGLAAFTAERRTKEIGIRKVLGARSRDIVRLLTWQFSKPVIIANLIAWPVAWWAMRDWLNSFDTRIDLGPGPFLLAGVLALAIAIGTIAGHALKVARANPIHALRYE
ncbi:ABC transporter permease [Allosphingosinicella indica]|uniref:Putative ABC transport system permease protein n=1 Tax=Allosphingosinicella indica TaxID=941907 RepID=A0A1X7G903_9SPHN|nr:ABC transporter permease [Allosphingosinicella indica]SMF66030.1 putative ABC transport system permease protein [Allosphingosinicella indica]